MPSSSSTSVVPQQTIKARRTRNQAHLRVPKPKLSDNQTSSLSVTPITNRYIHDPKIYFLKLLNLSKKATEISRTHSLVGLN